MIYRTERCNARASGDRSLSFFPVKGALTHHCPKGSGGIPPCGRAVRSSRSIHRMLLQRGQTMPQFFKPPSLSVRLADGFRLVCLFAANRCPLPGQPATRLRKPATGSFVAVMDDATPHRPFSFVSAKETKPPHTGAERK